MTRKVRTAALCILFLSCSDGDQSGNTDGASDADIVEDVEETVDIADATDGVDTEHEDGTTPGCGNGMREVGEECDGTDLGSETCVGLGFLWGDLACSTDCTYDTSGCSSTLCGNGTRDSGEDCDGYDLGPSTCESLGYSMGGYLVCKTDCTFDLTECCGDGTAGTSEECDDGNTVDWDGCTGCVASEFPVSTTAPSARNWPNLAVGNDGRFICAWCGGEQRSQLVDSTATLTGAELMLTTWSPYTPTVPTLAMATDGRFVIVWVDDYEIYARKYFPSVTPAGSEWMVNTFTTGWQFDPSMGMALDGSFVVVWTSQGQDGSFFGIFGQRFDASGVPIGSEFQCNTFTLEEQQAPDVATTDDGRFIVVWESDGQDGSSLGVFAQLYDATGTRVGAEYQVNTYSSANQREPSVAMDGSGRFVIVWTSQNQDGHMDGVFARRYDAAGTAVGPEFQVNTTYASNQYSPDVGMAADGRFVVVWMSQNQDGDGLGVFGQRYNATGTTVGVEFQVNRHATGGQVKPRVEMADDGRFVIVWTDNGLATATDGPVMAIRYNAAGEARGKLPW